MKKKSKDEKYPKQKQVVPFGFAPKGDFAYEPYKKSDVDSPSLDKALRFFAENPEHMGKPSGIDTGNKLVEFDTGKKHTYEEVLQSYQKNAVDKESEKGKGFFDGPVDLGKRPKGDFPSVQWMPRGKEDLDVDPNETTAKQAELDLSNKELVNQLIEDYMEKIPWDEWYESYFDAELERLQDEALEYRYKLREDHVEKHFENLTVDDWIELYGDNMKEYLNDELAIAETVEDLEKWHPGFGKMYIEYMQGQFQEQEKHAMESPLSEEEQDQIAAKYGPEYNSAILHYYTAVTNGHPEDRALDYAVAELQKVESYVDKSKILEIKNTYLTGKVPKREEK